MAGDKVDLARQKAVLRTIPNTHADISVTGSAQKFNLNAIGGKDLRGKFIFLRAVTGDIGIKRGDHVSTMTADEGLQLRTTDPPSEFFVDPDGNTEFTVRAGGNVTLRIYYDSEL